MADIGGISLYHEHPKPNDGTFRSMNILQHVTIISHVYVTDEQHHRLGFSAFVSIDSINPAVSSNVLSVYCCLKSD